MQLCGLSSSTIQNVHLGLLGGNSEPAKDASTTLGLLTLLLISNLGHNLQHTFTIRYISISSQPS